MCSYGKLKIFINQKVILCEHKGHTDRRVASSYGVPTLAGGTYLGGGTYPGRRYPPWLGVFTLAGGGTYLGRGTHLSWGTHLGLGSTQLDRDGVPLPYRQTDRLMPVKTLLSVVLRTRAVNICDPLSKVIQAASVDRAKKENRKYLL